MDRRTFLASLAGAGLANAATKQPPNIVILFADDLGYSDIGCFGGEIHTPNLDSLAKEGVRFTQFYNTARCCPSRATLLSGLYAHQAGMGGTPGRRNAPADWRDRATPSESLGCRNVAPGRQQKVNGLPCGIHGAVQILVLALHLYIRLVDAEAFVGRPQVRAAPLVQFRAVDLDPAPDATGMDEQPALERHLGHVHERDRKPQVPSHAPEDDVARIMAPFEGIRRRHGHVSPYQIKAHPFRNDTLPGSPLWGIRRSEVSCAQLEQSINLAAPFWSSTTTRLYADSLLGL
jgi:hypothetical protein